MSGVQKRVVTPDEGGMRLDRWFKTHFPALRHGELEKLLRKGQVRVAGGRAKSNRRLEPGEEIRIPPISSPQENSASKQREVTKQDAAFIKKLILFEDDALIALNKPFGLAVQGGTNTKQHIDGMLEALAEGSERPRLVHRLDKDTGGLLLVAKTRLAAQRLGDAFKKHSVEKTYWALTAGVPRPRQGTINLPVAKNTDGKGREKMEPAHDSAKKAITHYQTLDEAGRNVAFLAMQPVTGRTHQLRVHAAAIECPIVGDGKYGGEAAHLPGVSSKLHLFCRSMSFPHPKTGRVTTLTAPLTDHMLDTWRFFAFDENAACEWPEDMS